MMMCKSCESIWGFNGYLPSSMFLTPELKQWTHREVLVLASDLQDFGPLHCKQH